MFARAWWDDRDDAERLVFADALTARGDPRGEFVLLQCTRPEDPRVGALWSTHHVAWLLELELPHLGWAVKRPGLSSALFGAKSGLEAWTAQFERGFLTRLWVPRLHERQSEALRGGATLRHLETEERDVRALVRQVAGFSLEALGVTGATSATVDDLRALTTSQTFSQLAELTLNAGTVDAEARAAHVIDAAASAQRLTRLHLTGALGLAPLRALRKAEWARARLTHLEVSSFDASEELPALLEALPRLEQLTLNVHHARVELAEALLAHPALKQARIRTSAPTLLPEELGRRLRARLGPEALVRF